ncbi:hypothetical protein Godav_003930, partial [Gossypium davidsonii]|nr:hypothetical protein [Gossypium davidsonii]MBA0661826.1 hypothetical protein [Gossypium klotzschianum]
NFTFFLVGFVILKPLFRLDPKSGCYKNDLKKVIIGQKPMDMNQLEWDELDENALSIIQLSVEHYVVGGTYRKKDNSCTEKIRYPIHDKVFG